MDPKLCVLPRPFFLVSLMLLVTIWKHSYGADGVEREVYIVYMGSHGAGDSAPTLHLDILNTIIPESHHVDINKLLIHSYKRSFSGFSAYLTEQEAKELARMKGVVSVFPSKSYKPQTTRSWEFIGLPLNASRTYYESDVIVGIIDSGIWPESESFNDKGIGPPPRKWKGTCQSSKNFKCNNKIIGARYYKTQRKLGSAGMESAQPSPRDMGGHGTHMASTVAGREVVGAGSMYGMAEGVARGGVPSSRIAVYKACWNPTPSDGYTCAAEDILAAFDDAIADGVDVILAAIENGGGDYFNDAMAIGSFHAMQRGILTSAPAGDTGLFEAYFSVLNFAPWIVTVGASTIDRNFRDSFVLGDGTIYTALQLNSFASQEELLPLVYGGDAPRIRGQFYREASKRCAAGSLDRELVQGKIVICDSDVLAGPGAATAGAMGFIFSDGSLESPCDVPLDISIALPSICLGSHQLAQVKNYTRNTRRPRGRVLRSEPIHDPMAPKVADFSAKGPNSITLDILKPDIVAPGFGILAAWSPKARLTNQAAASSSASTVYNILWGTSVASAHVAALAAYVKSFHPTWSPAAIRSALMTTALPMSYPPNEILGPLAYGAGQTHAESVLDPGLVYDAHERDYINMLCKQGYDAQMLRNITGDPKAYCDTGKGTVWDLNYPSFSLSATGLHAAPFNATFRRTVTNVGSPNSTYRAVIHNPSAAWFKIDVEPRILSFQSLLEKKSFSVHVRGIGKPRRSLASLVWKDGVHNVRSPIFADFYAKVMNA